MAIGIVDVAQQVQVGHDDGQGPVKPLGAGQFTVKLFREVGMVEEAGLAVDLRFPLQGRDPQCTVEQVGWDDKQHQRKWIVVPDDRQAGPKIQQGKVEQQRKEIEHAWLPEVLPACQPYIKAIHQVFESIEGGHPEQDGRGRAPGIGWAPLIDPEIN